MSYLDYFQLEPDLIHLNHAAVGPWPTATAEVVKAFADENAHVGSRHYGRWMQAENQLRKKLAQLIHANSEDDIALLKSTSEGLSFIAHGLSWKQGQNIIIPEEEFPSNRIVWESLHDQGVEVRLVPITQSESPEKALIEAMDQHTRLLSCSSVQYASGLRLDLERLGEACQQRQLLFCVDAIQSLGAISFDVEAVQADFVVADGHKWMLAPEGLALFYCREELRDELKLHEYGWHMVEAMHDFNQRQWSPARTARRFECGSPNMVGIAALNASLDVLFEVGISQVEKAVLHNNQFLYDALKAVSTVQILSPEALSRRAGIITFKHQAHDSQVLYDYLLDNNVICAQRGGGIRLSPHFYNTEAQLATVIQMIKNCPE